MKCKNCVWIREGKPVEIAFSPEDTRVYPNIYCDALPHSESVQKDRKGCIYYDERLND
jgi:hypothetical protein